MKYNLTQYVYDFQQPVALYAYHLVALHNSIMYYVFVILVLVYWCLYKILRDFSWHVFNKQVGFFRFYFGHKIFLYLEYFFLNFIWYIFFLVNIYIYMYLLNLYSRFFKKSDAKPLFSVKTLNEDFLVVRSFYIDSYISYILFAPSTRARYFYTYKENPLKTLF